ncbi:hypothetical protein [Paenibacillus albidus]|uniref:hypothetical protein n=1 Tax=Paenibacillus albidus TaxID=2041023 RepID=UPI001BE7A6CD|nr:hypothetical protein [Paenibacillus albidus]
MVSSSEPGTVKAWWDIVHEHGTREYGNGNYGKVDCIHCSRPKPGRDLYGIK